LSDELYKLQGTVAATVGNAYAYIKGLRGVFRILAVQHSEVRCLVGHALSAPDLDSQHLRWRGVRCALLAHERAEEAVVYTLLASFPTTEQLSQRHDVGAHELMTLIEQLDTLPPTASLRPKLAEVSARLAKHAEEEEGEYFVRGQQHIGQGRAEALIAPFTREYQRQLAQLGEEPPSADSAPATLRDGTPSSAHRQH
jgi:hypothetical protein